MTKRRVSSRGAAIIRAHNEAVAAAIAVLEKADPRPGRPSVPIGHMLVVEHSRPGSPQGSEGRKRSSASERSNRPDRPDGCKCFGGMCFRRLCPFRDSK